MHTTRMYKVMARTWLLALCWAAPAPLAAALPPEVVAQLSPRLPAALVPMPASGQTKIFPLASEKSGSLDRRYAIAVDKEPLALTAVSPDGKAVGLSVHAGPQDLDWTNRWFKAEDVFGKVKWKVEPYEPEVPCLVYFPRGKGPVDLVGKMAKGTRAAALGAAVAAKSPFRLVQMRSTYTASGESCEFMIALLRENPPVATAKEYEARAKQMMEEYAFRTGRPWGRMFPSLLGNTGCFECAAMAGDAATYLFDVGFGAGEKFEKVEEIRSGDIVHFMSHYFFVVHRKGGQLTTIEGNMNESVSQSSKRYAIVGGKLVSGGAELQFTHGFHNWPAPK